MGRRSALTFRLTVLVLLAVFSPSMLPRSAKGSGMVYVAPTIQPSVENGTDVVLAVMAANVDPFTGWNVEVRVDPLVLLPKTVTYSGNLLVANFSASLFELTSCVNGLGFGCAPEDGLGIVHSAAAAFSIHQGTLPYSGLLFTITYSALNGGSGTSTIEIIRQAIIDGQSATIVPVTTAGGFYGDSADFGVTSESAFVRSTPSSSFGLNYSIESFNGFSGTVSLFADSLLPALVLPTSVTVADNAVANARVLVSADPCGQGGSYGMSIVGTSDHVSHSFLSHVDLVPSGQELPDFCIRTADRSLVVQQGGLNSSIVQLISLNGFVGNVTLATRVFPEGPSAILGETMMTLVANRMPLVHLNVTSDVQVPVGRYSLLVNATSGPLTRFAVVELTVVPPRPGFQLSLPVPPLTTIPSGLSLAFNATLASVNGFSDPVALSARSFPSGEGLSVTVYPASVTVPDGGVEHSTLTIFTTPSTLQGIYIIVLGAQSGALVHVSTFAVNVTSPLTPPSVSSVDWKRAISISRLQGVETWTIGISNPNVQDRVWIDIQVSGTNSAGTSIFTVDSGPTLLAAGARTQVSLSTRFSTSDISSVYSFQVTIRFGLTPSLIVADGAFSSRVSASGSFRVIR